MEEERQRVSEKAATFTAQILQGPAPSRTLKEEEEQRRLRLQAEECRGPAAEKDGGAIGLDALGDHAHDAERCVGTSRVLDPALDDINGGHERRAELARGCGACSALLSVPRKGIQIQRIPSLPALTVPAQNVAAVWSIGPSGRTLSLSSSSLKRSYLMERTKDNRVNRTWASEAQASTRVAAGSSVTIHTRPFA